MSAKLLILPGDGIGPEIIAEAEKVLLVLTAPSEALYLSARNVPKLAINPASALQVYDVLQVRRLRTRLRHFSVPQSRLPLELLRLR